MSERLSLEQIRQFWTDQAKQHGRSPAASWSDTPVIDMEIREIAARLADGDRVLDVGCANGYSTIQLASQRRINIRGLDYIPEMIRQAKLSLTELAGKIPGSVEFDTGDITDLRESDVYDKVVVIRVVINLASWERQALALKNVAAAVKRGGLLLLSEATLQGWNQLNRFRHEWGLPDIPMPGFNLYLDQDQVVSELRDAGMELVEIANFASTYFVGTRIFKPLLAKALGSEANVADPGMEINRFFAALPAAGDWGTQKLFVFRKR
jgi:2-polyprenyl-3-methyl-5-hydroxy-6-metoxy-1,4-benzoquinol methylase